MQSKVPGASILRRSTRPPDLSIAVDEVVVDEPQVSVTSQPVAIEGLLSMHMPRSSARGLPTVTANTASSAIVRCSPVMASAKSQRDLKVLTPLRQSKSAKYLSNASGNQWLKPKQKTNVASKYITWAPGSPHVTFASPSQTTVHPVTPYSQIYGMHPSLFNYDKTGQKVLVASQVQRHRQEVNPFSSAMQSIAGGALTPKIPRTQGDALRLSRLQ